MASGNLPGVDGTVARSHPAGDVLSFDGPLRCIDLLWWSGLFASRSEVRRAVAQHGVRINWQTVMDPNDVVPLPLADRYYVIRWGKQIRSIRFD